MGDRHEQVLCTLSARNGGSPGQEMGIELIEVTAQRVVARMPVAEDNQPLGLVHAGSSVALAKTLGSVGAMMHAGRAQIGATDHRRPGPGSSPARNRATAGRTRATYDVLINDNDRTGAYPSRITCMIRPKPPGA